MESMTISLNPTIANRLASVDDAKRKYLEIQLQFRLYELLFGTDNRSISQIMDDIGQQAENNKLTPDILNEILNEK